MAVDFTKFPFPGVENPHAATLTEAITAEPVPSGFVFIGIKLSEPGDLAEPVRAFAPAVRAQAAETGLIDITAYREIRPDELGGAMPFDQAICEASVRDAERHRMAEPDRYPTIPPALKMEKENDIADWGLFIEYRTPDQALAAAKAFGAGGTALDALTGHAKSRTVGAFKNMMRYSHVSRDPNVIQFFNLFPGPGSVEELWPAWQEALPWFFETGEFRSSFPIVSLDPEQPLLLINVAHVDSIKHFFLGVSYDPTYLETVKRCYVDRGFKLPMPFFCKIVPV